MTKFDKVFLVHGGHIIYVKGSVEMKAKTKEATVVGKAKMPNGDDIDINNFVNNGAQITRFPNDVIFIIPQSTETPTDYIA